MLLIVNSVYSFSRKKQVKKEMVDSIYKIIGELCKGQPLKLKHLGGEVIKISNVIRYKFLEDKLIVETVCTRYEFKICYD